MPEGKLSSDQLSLVSRFYAWRGSSNDFRWATEENLERVRAYLSHWEAECYWSVVLQNGARGYSMFLHERAEIDTYKRLGADHLDHGQQAAHYGPSHAWGLLEEHRFLETVARVMNCPLSLRELIMHNPHGDPPDDEWEGDWELLARELPDQLSGADWALEPGRADEARDFYRRLGFKRVSHDAKGD
jgi:hypothetical protein